MSTRRKPYTLKAATRCHALDQNGGRCRRTAVRMVTYHGDYEMYGAFSYRPEPSWVVVPLCDQHSSEDHT